MVHLFFSWAVASVIVQDKRMKVIMLKYDVFITSYVYSLLLFVFDVFDGGVQLWLEVAVEVFAEHLPVRHTADAF